MQWGLLIPSPRWFYYLVTETLLPTAFFHWPILMTLGSQILLNVPVSGSCEATCCVFGAPAKRQVRQAAESSLVYCSITSLKFVAGGAGRCDHARTTFSHVSYLSRTFCPPPPRTEKQRLRPTHRRTKENFGVPPLRRVLISSPLP